jgi:diadenosine tetraphosphatase ApaH/serine/threonine PP2A family protein phosphatase
MKIAVISDIHGNLEALSAVLADIERTGAGEIVSLGDNVGYGGDPEEVTQLLRSLRIPSVMGNHELGIARPEYISWFNASARESLILTGRLLSPESKEWLAALPASLVFRECLFVHGCPPDSITDYIFEQSDSRLIRRFGRAEQQICFVGHTHTLELITIQGRRVVHMQPGRETLSLSPGARHIVNAGSVGQPRDGDGNAKYVIWDSATHSLEVRFIPYDVERAAEKIIRQGFPRFNATRLW